MIFKGSSVALVTPMQKDGSIDYEALFGLVDWHIDAGTESLVVLGTTGESSSLTLTEREHVIAAVVSQVNGRVPVIVGTGAASTSVALEYTQQAQSLGANGALLVTPYYVKPTQQGLFEHFSLIAQRCSIPQVLYNVPSRSGCDLQPETVARLAREPAVVALKEATGDLHRLKALLDLQCGLTLLSGDDASSADFMLQGGHGVISVTANIAPEQVKAVCTAALSGDGALARQLNEPLRELHASLFLESNPIPVKWLLEDMGRIQGTLRLPLTSLGCMHHEMLRMSAKSAGVNFND